jgi:hypothetical protein
MIFIVRCDYCNLLPHGARDGNSWPGHFKEIADAAMYLTDAETVTGDLLYVDGGARFGQCQQDTAVLKIRLDYRFSLR